MIRRLLLIITALTVTLCTLGGCADSSGSSEGSQSSQGESGAEVTTVPVSPDESSAQTTTEAPVVTLEQKETTVINETPATYESLQKDAAEAAAFKEKIESESSIPVISITTEPDAKIVSLETYVSCVVDVFNCDSGDEISQRSAGIKVRGNSSAFYGDVNQILRNQVPYRIKFDEKCNMLGLNDGNQYKSWVLLRSDWDLIRNDIALRMGRAIFGDHAYCSDAQLVHVYINEKFKGIYLLCEQNQINAGRVEVSEVPEGYTGTDIGYYLELDNCFDREAYNHWFRMDYDEAVVTDINGVERQFVPAEYSIKNDLYSQNQIDFIDKYMNNLFTIVYEACANDKYYTFDENYDLTQAPYSTAEETVSAVIDIESVVNMYILYEIVHDYDCGEGSFFMCIDFSENSSCPKLQFTSPWDFNWAYNDSPTKYHAAAFNAKSFVNQYGDRSNPWFILLMCEDWFKQSVMEKWTALEADGTMMDCITAEIDLIEKYKDDLNKTEAWATENSYKLLEWITKRIYWLDKQWIIGGK